MRAAPPPPRYHAQPNYPPTDAVFLLTVASAAAASPLLTFLPIPAPIVNNPIVGEPPATPAAPSAPTPNRTANCLPPAAPVDRNWRLATAAASGAYEDVRVANEFHRRPDVRDVPDILVIRTMIRH